MGRTANVQPCVVYYSMNNMKNEIKIGDTVKVKSHDWVGTVVGSAFGKPESGQLRVHLSFGLTHDFYAEELTKTD